MISTNDVKPGMALQLREGLFQIVERGHGVVLPHKLAAKRIEHCGDVAVQFH